MTALVAGWFSFEDGHATAGDLLAAQVVRRWLEEAGVDHELAAAPPFKGDVDWREADPGMYDAVIFVCGPFDALGNEAAFFERFEGRPMLGVNLSMPQSPERWNPFDTLLERDSPTTGRADLAFAAETAAVPVVGVCLVEDYPEALTAPAHQAVRSLLERFEAASLPVDTRLDVNATGLRSEREVESLLAATDLIVTTRLHGLVLGVKNGVPVLPIDPAPGGGKIVRQAQTIGWPVCFVADELSAEALDRAFQFCLTEDARSAARECSLRAREAVERARDDFLAGLASGFAGAGVRDLRERSRARLRLARPASESPAQPWLRLPSWLARRRHGGGAP